MDLTYKRVMYRPDGIFSTVTRDDTGEHFMVVLEHAYQQPDGSWKPKVQPGVYTCVRGMHTLGEPPHQHQLETFEILGVVGHSGILLHPGNWDEDSAGCSLVGSSFAQGNDPHEDGKLVEMVVNSQETFKKFMAAQEGLDSFQLTVLA